LTLEDFEKKKIIIQESLGKQIEFRNQGKYLTMLIYENNLKDRYTYKPITYKDLEIPLGISNAGPVSFKFNDQYVHLLVGGTTGSGKGNFILQAITNLILTHNIKDLQIYIIDLKKAVEAQIFKNCEMVKEITETEEDTFKLLSKIEAEMHRRYELFKKSGCISIKNYKQKMPKFLIVIDELANLRHSKRIKNKLIDLLAQSRATGIHFILSTQRPDSTVIDGLIKANTQATLAFSCRNRINSQILIDNDDATRLNIPGRSIFQTFKNIEIQIYYLSEQRARFLLKPFNTKKENKTNTSGVIKIEEVNNTNNVDFDNMFN
jgi:S-DNA-T family DNA segregation ATPase FtsK/SpoIIIE